MEINQNQIDKLIIEGKTKKVFTLRGEQKYVYIYSKDRITAGDGAKSHAMEGKARLSTQTNCAIYEFLNAAGIATHFVSRVSENCKDWDRSFVAKQCDMIPIEWVCRRVASGSYLKRHPNVKEGYRFAPVKLETFFKDDENHDPFWSTETLIEAGLTCGGLKIGKIQVEEMYRLTQTVFEVLERVWSTLNHSLIDMKIEFGVIEESGVKKIVVGDVIDNDSWRLWPNGDKRLMLDKQIYRNLDNSAIDEAAIQAVKSKFELVAERTHALFGSMIPKPRERGLPPPPPEVGIILGSMSDMEHAQKIKNALSGKYGINDVEIHVCSAHKSTEATLSVLASLMQWPTCQVIIACAGRSNGLGPVSAGNTTVPVINCPPISDSATLSNDIWSSMRLPSGVGCTTILGADNAALAAAHIIANLSPFTWARIRSQQTYTIIKMLYDDASIDV